MDTLVNFWRHRILGRWCRLVGHAEPTIVVQEHNEKSNIVIFCPRCWRLLGGRPIK